jgi:hypothetical protein
MLAIKINIHFHLFRVPNFEMVYACMYITPNDQYKQMKRTSTNYSANASISFYKHKVLISIVVSSYPVHSEVYSIQHYVIKCQ